MTTSNKFKFAVMALAIVGSTSSVLAASTSQTSDAARGEQRRSYTRATSAYDARANVQSKQDRFVPSEPFTAAEKRKFQTPTGREVDSW